MPPCFLGTAAPRLQVQRCCSRERQDAQEPWGRDREMKSGGPGGQKEGLGWGPGAVAEGSREEELDLPGRTELFRCFIRRLWCPSP